MIPAAAMDLECLLSEKVVSGELGGIKPGHYIHNIRRVIILQHFRTIIWVANTKIEGLAELWIIYDIRSWPRACSLNLI